MLGQFDDEIGQPPLALRIGEAGLGLVMIARQEAGQLQSPLQLGLAPVAGGLFIAFEGGRQVGGLGVHLEADVEDLFDLRLQGGVALNRLRCVLR